jgi:Fe-S-cluster containining protein
MSEVSCQTCTAACCKGPETMELSAEEADFMLAGGNTLIPIAEPVDYDRDRVLYPQGWQMDDVFPTNPKLAKPLVVKGSEYEPLDAGMGRYTLWGVCKYLLVTEDGSEVCRVYDQRPNVCKDFPVGGQKCRLMRVMAGVDEPTEEYPNKNDLLK